MLQFNQWNKTTMQVGLEGATFIYVHRLPFAVKGIGDQTAFVNAALCQVGTDALECYEKLELMNWSLAKLSPTQFREKVNQVYAQALIAGARRVGMECINLKEKSDVDNQQNSPGHIEDRNAWNRRTRPKADD